MQLVTQFINIINELIYRASHCVESNGTVWNREVDENEEDEGNEDGGDDLVGGADDPEVVEGAPGRLLSRHHLVLTSPVAHPHLSIFFCVCL